MREYGDTFLLAPFREFYREVTRLKRMVGTGPWVTPAGEEPFAEADAAGGPAGTWVYFPHLLPDPDDDFETAPPSAAPTAPATREGRSARRAGGATLAGAGAALPGNGSAAPHGSLSDAAACEQLAPSDHARVCTHVWQRLLALFERQEEYAFRYGGMYGAEFYKEAQYVMAALADEIFINTNWVGRRYWLSNLLETRLFQTHAAGELFFQKLDRLLDERDPVNRDLGAVYLMALSLGFRGRHRGGREDAARLLQYRRRLFSFVFRREPELENESRRLFPETYYHTMREETRRKLPNPRAWIVLLCAAVIAYVAVTHGIWVNLTARLHQVNKSITETVQTMK